MLTSSSGQIDESIIDAERQSFYLPIFSTAHSSRRRLAGQNQSLINPDTVVASGSLSCETPLYSTSEANQPDWATVSASWSQGRPALFVSDSSPDHIACGWMFDQSKVFVPESLLSLCNALQPVVLRIKGIFRTGEKMWCSLQVDEAKGGMKLVPIAYRRESRFEVILPREKTRSGRSGRSDRRIEIEADESDQGWISVSVKALIRHDWESMSVAWRHIVKEDA